MFLQQRCCVPHNMGLSRYSLVTITIRYINSLKINNFFHSADFIWEGEYPCRSGSAEVGKCCSIIGAMTVNWMLRCLAKEKGNLSFPIMASQCLTYCINQLLLNQEAKSL